MSTITSKQSKADVLVHVQALMAGTEKRFPNGSFTLENATYTTASLVQAFKALADTLREEVNAAGIRVMNVFPGRTATPRIASLHELEGRPFQPEVLLQPEDIASVVVSALSIPWTAEVKDISIRPMLKSY